jgi:hypothetical protein
MDTTKNPTQTLLEAATPRPWRLASSPGRDVMADVQGELRLIASIHFPPSPKFSFNQVPERDANSRLIVEAVNGFERAKKIEAALREALDCLLHDGPNSAAASLRSTGIKALEP